MATMLSDIIPASTHLCDIGLRFEMTGRISRGLAEVSTPTLHRISY